LAAVAPAGAGPLVGIQIPNRTGRRHAYRAWPRENVVALATALAGDGCRVLLCGTGAERPEAEAIRSRLPGAALSPLVPLAAFAAVLRGLDIFISPYIGTLHLADAVGTATVAYGQPEQVSGWSPLGPRHLNIAGRATADIPVALVLAAVRELLAAARR